MEAEKIISTPIPADEQHSTLEVHQPAPIAHQNPEQHSTLEVHQPAPIAHQNTYMQPPTSLPQYPPQQQPLSQPPGQEYYHTGPGMGHPSGYNTATPLHSLKRGPTPVDCPVCGQRGMTRAEAQTGKTTHGWAAVLCCACLGWIPYLMSSLKDVNHYCGKCGVMLATWHNSGRVEVHHAGKN